jgi:hypothetical protein
MGEVGTGGTLEKICRICLKEIENLCERAERGVGMGTGRGAWRVAI